MSQQNQQNYINIDDFFTMNLGDWLGQKTSYNPNSKIHTTSTAKTSITKIDNSEKKPNLLLENDNNQAFSISSQKSNKKADCIVKYIRKCSSNSNGVIYKVDNKNKDEIIEGKFELLNGVLKILINKDTLTIEETIWFVNNNLKLTKSIAKKNNQCVLISFASEIKVIVN
nr:Ycf58 [Erythrotrichia longistipitata]